MSNELFQHYGYCEIPKGTKLYRAGEIYNERGATFALHPSWAMNFTSGSSKVVLDYEVVENINVLFLISHLDWRGFPVSAIEVLYNAKVEQIDTLDDIDIKFRNTTASTKFKNMLASQNIRGWLTTIEGNEPLEVFLLSDTLRSIKQISKQLIERFLMKLKIRLGISMFNQANCLWQNQKKIFKSTILI
jgi:hypothetical protein